MGERKKGFAKGNKMADVLLKEFEDDAVHFCALVNGALGKGRELVRPEQVESVPTESYKIVETESDETRHVMHAVQRLRDQAKRVRTEDGDIFISIQNQGKTDYGMPLRVMTEDALEYDMQRRRRPSGELRRGEKLTPVITIVFYHGGRRWNGPKDMREIVKMPETLADLCQYVQHYPIIVVDPETADASRFAGGWKEILEALKWQHSEAGMRKYLRENRETFERLPEETNRLIFALTGHLEYYDELKRKGETKISMCKAFEDHYRSGVRVGERRGKRQGQDRIITAFIKGSLAEGQSMEEVGEKLQRYFAFSPAKAENYMHKQLLLKNNH